VYRTHVPAEVRLASGTWVRLRCGGWSAYALWDTEGPIALRIFSERGLPDAAWLRARVREAWELREPLRASCTAYRWLFGEGDGLPGLTVDRYGEYAVALAYSRGVASLLLDLAGALRACDPSLRGIVSRAPSDDELQPAGRRERILWGEVPPRDLVVEEHGLRFTADLQGGQKTGLFLDQRENRRYVEQVSAGRRVLNCFAYTGGFSLYALRGGASEVVSADIGKGLADAAAANLRLNGLPAERHRFVTGDCFELLEQYAAQGRTFDLVILDPPSFAKSKQNRYAALRAYTRLNTLALRCVIPGGLLASASCTSQVGPEEFKEMLAAAGGAAARRLQIVHEAGQPIDHPVPAHFPEGRYLKFVMARVSPIE
jgi:23S rRNA (cytosine1962-C5)-methyltransferase